ncbi:MAG: hypothetical protein WBD06_05125 [Acidobacteriaceae bacterium]
MARTTKSKRKRAPKTVLKLPDLEPSKSAVLNSLTSHSSQPSYDHATFEYVSVFKCGSPPIEKAKGGYLRSKSPTGVAGTWRPCPGEVLAVLAANPCSIYFAADTESHVWLESFEEFQNRQTDERGSQGDFRIGGSESISCRLPLGARVHCLWVLQFAIGESPLIRFAQQE